MFTIKISHCSIIHCENVACFYPSIHPSSQPTPCEIRFLYDIWEWPQNYSLIILHDITQWLTLRISLYSLICFQINPMVHFLCSSCPTLSPSASLSCVSGRTLQTQNKNTNLEAPSLANLFLFHFLLNPSSANISNRIEVFKFSQVRTQQSHDGSFPEPL